jgi:protein phosphatase
MVREGELTPEQAEGHPQRSIITRALGIDPQVDVDVYPIQLQAGDRILLCSDGLTTMVRSDEIARILAEEPDPARAAQRLVDAANAAGGEDNVTAVVVNVIEGDSTDALTAVPEYEEAEEEDTTEPQPRRVRRRRRRGRGRRIARMLLWTLPVLAVLALAFGAVGWYARRTYFVGVDKSRVTIFKGRPGGVLGWDPTVERRTIIDLNQLTEAEKAGVKDKKTFSSRGGADDYVRRLRRAIEERTPPSTVPPPTAPTVPPTTAPPAVRR